MVTMNDMKSIIDREFKRQGEKVLHIREDIGTIFLYGTPNKSHKLLNALRGVFWYKPIACMMVFVDLNTNKSYLVTGCDDLNNVELEEYDPQQREIDRLKSTVETCRQQFHSYVSQHMAKSPPDFEKAAKNYEFMLRCNHALKENP